MVSVATFLNAVASVARPPTLLVLLPASQSQWCEQFSQEGYNVLHIDYPVAAGTSFRDALKEAETHIIQLGAPWGLVTYGLDNKDAETIVSRMALSIVDLKANVHFCPSAESTRGFLLKDSHGRYAPVTFHLAASQESLQALILPYEDPSSFDYELPTHSHPPVKAYTYPLMSASPPFPFGLSAPTATAKDTVTPTNSYLRSACSLSHSRTLELLKRHLGPHFNFEKLWEAHTYFEFSERNAQKTMATMVGNPYVNHIPTMTGGVGYDDLARFYKYHFTKVTPADAEMIPISRTVGSDRIIDEMVFKFHHTEEIDYFLPGVSPTGKYVEIALVGVIAFRGDKLFFEHIYWDQASLLVQVGLLDPTKLPVAGVEVARKAIDPFGMPSNTLLGRWHESEGQPIE